MTVLMAIFFLATAGTTNCGQAGGSNAHIQWSASAIATAPDHSSQLEVHPVLTSDENASPVVLRSCADGSVHQLFTLERSADVYWGPTSIDLLIINQPNADKYDISMFSARGQNSGMVEKIFNDAVVSRLLKAEGPDRRVVFYLPRFISWKGNELLLAVGGATVAAKGGPMSSYCYGMMINSQTLQISRTFSAEDLKRQYAAECQLAP